jgi:translation initiation factor IF-3
VGSAAPNRDDGIICNEKITARTVLLIDNEGRNLGETPTIEARRRASALGLGLVQVSMGIVPTVKILDVSLYRYEQKIAAREAAAKQRANRVETKEVQISPVIQDNDLRTIAKKASRFLSNGDKVKIVVRFEGRQLGHTELGRTQIEKLLSMITGGCTVENAPTMSGDRSMTCLVSPPPASV